MIGACDILWITLDSLRYDVAARALEAGQTPNLARLMPEGRWQKRLTPGCFTYSAHHAFFAGYLPTPVEPGLHPRRFACRFAGSQTTGPDTVVLDAASVPEGLSELGYHTLCIGGVGFFNPGTPLGRVLPGLFQESVWRPELGVTALDSTAHQVREAVERMRRRPRQQRIFLFLNVSATHQPTVGYVPGATVESVDTQQAALAYADSQLPPLLEAMAERGPVFAVACADHGTCHGEDGYWGHRQSHPLLWTVPYTEAMWTG
ncbi:MAG: STM4013/SEN3800 family hydrolase [Candidatus Eremiobacterota bacterium]